MTGRATIATARRILAQLRGDPRTIALIMIVPLVLLGLLKLLLANDEATFQQVGAPLLGIFPLVVMFLVTSVTMLRERTSGTLERLMTLPMRRGDLVLGYALAFAVVAAAQALVATGFAVGRARARRRRVDRRARRHRDPQRRARHGASAWASRRSRRPSSRPCSSCPRSSFPSSCSAACSCPRSAMSPALDALAGVLPMTYAYEALADVAAGDGVRGRPRCRGHRRVLPRRARAGNAQPAAPDAVTQPAASCRSTYCRIPPWRK